MRRISHQWAGGKVHGLDIGAQGRYFKSRGANFKSRGIIYATRGAKLKSGAQHLGPPGAGFLNYVSTGGGTCQVMHSGLLIALNRLNVVADALSRAAPLNSQYRVDSPLAFGTILRWAGPNIKTVYFPASPLVAKGGFTTLHGATHRL